MPNAGGALPCAPSKSLGQCARHILALCGLLALAGCGGAATRSNLAFASADTAPWSGFVAVASNVRLHYLDWGGRGEVILLIPGLYGSPEIYSEFAPLLTDRFRVIALSRRGHGRSDEPPTGYEPDSLVEDIRAFFDSLGIGRAHLIATAQ